MSKTRQRISIGVLVGALVALVPVGARAATTTPPVGIFDVPCSSNSGVGDFNGDGVKDLAIGVAGDSIGGKSAIDGSTSQGAAAAGSVNVVYGVAATSTSPGGLDPTAGPQYFSEDNLGLADLFSENGDSMGYSVATGNFDGVGGSDLAIGIPGKDGQAGEVVVIYSQVGGKLNPATAEIWKPGFNGMKGTPQAGAEFGFSLAAANFNGVSPSADSLVIGAPRYDVSGLKDAGQGWIITGIHGVGLVGQLSATFNQGTAAVTGGPKAEAGNLFTGALAAGDLSPDALSDLAVGAPGDDIGSAADAGSVEIRYGDAIKPLFGPKPSFFSQGSNGVNGSAQTGARWGCSLAVADFNRDLFAGGPGRTQDLAVGAPGYKVGAATNAGAVSVIYNTATTTGLSAVDPGGRPTGSKWRDDQLFTQDTAGIPGVATKDDRFGASLAAGDFDNTLAFGLAIGEPTATMYGKTGAGSVRVLHGASGKGLTTAGSNAMAQSPAPATDACYLYNLLDQGCNSFPGGPGYSPLYMVTEKDDHFAATIAAGDFNKDGSADLSFGVPNEAYGEFFNWILEEQAGIGQDFLKDLGVPVSLSIDETAGAGIIQTVNAPFPTDANTPAAQQVIVRDGAKNDKTQGLGEGIRDGLSNIPGLVDANQIKISGQSADLTGDNFGGAQG